MVDNQIRASKANHAAEPTFRGLRELIAQAGNCPIYHKVIA
ncbi:MAG: hypothetical protein AAGI53_15855 [Planctomycetota bacterium]